MRILKIYISVLLVSFLFIIPCVIADDTISLGNPFGMVWEPIKNIFDFHTQSMEDLVPKMRFLFWIVIFTISFAVFRWLGNSNAGFSWLKGNIAVVLSIALSAISAIFVPDEALMAIGATYGEIGILILFLPVFVGLIAVAVQTKNRIAKIIILFIMLYMLLYFHNLFQSIETVDGMKTFTFKDYKINGQPVTVKGVADLIVVLGMGIIPIWLIIEVFMALSQGFGGGEGGGGGGGLFGRREGGDTGGGGGGGEPPGENLVVRLNVRPERVHAGDEVEVSAEIEGGRLPYNVQVLVDGSPYFGRPASVNARLYRTPRRINTRGFRVGRYPVTISVRDRNGNHADNGAWFEVETGTGTGDELTVRIDKPHHDEHIRQGTRLHMEAVVQNFRAPYRIIWAIHRVGDATALYTFDRRNVAAGTHIPDECPLSAARFPEGDYNVEAQVIEPTSPPGNNRHEVTIHVEAGTPRGPPKIKGFPAPTLADLRVLYHELSKSTHPDHIGFLWELLNWTSGVKKKLERFRIAADNLLRIREEINAIPAGDPRHAKLAALGANLNVFKDKAHQMEFVFATGHHVNVPGVGVVTGFGKLDDTYMQNTYGPGGEKYIILAGVPLSPGAGGHTIIGKTETAFRDEVEHHLTAPQQIRLISIIYDRGNVRLPVGNVYPIRKQTMVLMYYIIQTYEAYEKIKKGLP